jgi:hypothetical protein
LFISPFPNLCISVQDKDPVLFGFLDPDPTVKKAPTKKEKNLRNSMCCTAGYSPLRVGGFSCRLDVLHAPLSDQ